jgi:hypothetical protein
MPASRPRGARRPQAHALTRAAVSAMSFRAREVLNS